MNPTDLRDTLTSVRASVPVPPPDAVAFEARVTRVRRRRAAGRVALAAALVAAVATGAALVPRAEPVAPAEPVVVEPASAAVPLVVDGRLRMLGSDGTLGPAGPELATLVGSTPSGVVAFLADGSLARIVDGVATTLVDGPVRTAYLDGDSVLYETWTHQVRRLGQDGITARTDGGRLMAAGEGRYVIADPDGVVAHDADGAHPLWLGSQVTTVRQVQVGGDKVSVLTEDGLQVFDADGRRSAGTPGDQVGALAPDGHAYARPTADRRSVELLDADSLAATAVSGLSGTVREVAWTSDGDLVVVTSGRRLWRCPSASRCTEVLSEVGALRLR